MYDFDTARGDFQLVAASQTNEVLKGQNGAGHKGDILDRLIIIPASTSPGAVSIKDGTGASLTIFAGGASSLADLSPIFIPIQATSRLGAWQITTGANVSVFAAGRFT